MTPGSLAASGWLDLIAIRFVLFEDMGLLAEPEYRDRCVNHLVDIIVDIEDYRGARRIFIL